MSEMGTEPTRPVRPWDDYLAALSPDGVMAARVSAIVSQYAQLGIEVSDLFLSEDADSSSGLAYDSLWLFAQNLAMEARIPTDRGNELDAVPLHVKHVQLFVTDGTLEALAPQSRLRVVVWFSDTRSGELRATGENCKHLLARTREWFVAALD